MILCDLYSDLICPSYEPILISHARRETDLLPGFAWSETEPLRVPILSVPKHHPASQPTTARRVRLRVRVRVQGGHDKSLGRTVTWPTALRHALLLITTLAAINSFQMDGDVSKSTDFRLDDDRSKTCDACHGRGSTVLPYEAIFPIKGAPQLSMYIMYQVSV